jgi:type I restriction enzyme R subunit
MQGFSPRNLKYMWSFAEAWPDGEFVQAVLAQLPWYHQIALLDKLNLSDEQQRHVRENLSESELVIFDILTRPAPTMSAQEQDQVKRVARELLARIQETLVLEWRQRVVTRARVQLKIQQVLDTELPAAYDKALFSAKCQAIFAHICEKYVA